MGDPAGRSPLVNLAHLAAGALRYPRLHATQWLPPEDLKRLQWRRLERMLRHAFAHSPFYRQQFRRARMTPADIRCAHDLRRLPITTREDLRAADPPLAAGCARERLRVSMTSGSTGRRTSSYFDEPAWVLAAYLLKLRARYASGVRPLDRIALFQENAPTNPTMRPGARRCAFSIHQPTEQILPVVHAFAPTVLYGFPGYLARLARAAAGRLQPRLVFTSGELLDPATRRAIEHGFSAPVLDIYGCTEVKEIAWECPERQGYHINADWLFVEVEPTEARAGRLLVTSLYNFAMPLLRYDVGDTGRKLDGACACGRGLPLIRPTLGRSVDYLALPNGSVVAPYSLTCAVEAIEGMRQYQFVQTEPDVVELRVVPTADFGDGARQALLAALRPVLPGVSLRVRRLSSIPTERSGKYRIVQTRIRAGSST